MADKLFSETEVGDIMRRAAELQEKGSATGYVPGVTQIEMSRMASEIGIDPKFLEIAIQERGSAALAKSLPLYPTIERVYPVEIDVDDYDVITEYIKPYPTMNANGTASSGLVQVGRTLSGKAACSWANPDFKVTSRDGRTKVVVTSDQGTPIGISCIWLIPAIGSFISMFKISPPAGIIGMAVSAIFSYFTYKGAAKKSSEMTAQVAESIEKSITEYMDSRPKISSSPVVTETATDEEIQARLSE